MQTYRTREKAIEAALKEGAASAYVLRIKHGQYAFVTISPETPTANPVGIIKEGRFHSFSGK